MSGRLTRCGSLHRAAIISLVLVSSFLLTAPAGAATIPVGQTAVVANTNGDGVRLRADGGIGAVVLGAVPEGAVVRVVAGPKLDRDGTPWYRVDYAGRRGYLIGTYLVPAGDTTDAKPGSAGGTTVLSAMQMPDVKQGDHVRVADTAGAGVRLRDAAGYTANVLTILEEGAVVVVAGTPTVDTRGNGWVPVTFAGTTGYVVGPYLSKTDTAATVKAPLGMMDESVAPAPQSAPVTATSLGARVVAEAIKYVGYPYVWAGASPSGFDCSGFVLYIVQKVAGQNISHSIGQQASAGQYVAKENLQSGDLVFFANTYEAGLSHAGIYIGGGRFVHAENEGTGVVVSDINGGYYGSKYYTARRMG